jgi:hypothetical protein
MSACRFVAPRALRGVKAKKCPKSACLSLTPFWRVLALGRTARRLPDSKALAANCRRLSCLQGAHFATCKTRGATKGL